MPLLVVTARFGASSEEDQRFWLPRSPQSRQVVLEGGHELFFTALGDTLAAIRELLTAL